MEREQKIVRTSILGIIMNVILVGFKMTVGFLANSIAIILDAVNNLSDALSSIITIAGTKLAAKKPNRKHPYGYGRVEYITSVIIAVIVLVAGVTSLKESVMKLIHPQKASYQVISLIIIGVAVVVKFVVGRYVKAVGKKVNSGALIASGTDAFFDSILSFATLLTALASMLWNISLEGAVGVIISLIIIKAGFGMLGESMGSIIGTRAELELVMALKAQINAIDGVKGTYDVTLHNYGPSKLMGSVHVEVDDSMGAAQIHALSRRIMEEVYLKTEILLTVGIYASNLDNEKSRELHDYIAEVIKDYPEIIQFHGFYRDDKVVSFDLVIDFQADSEKLRAEVEETVKEHYPEYRYLVAVDSYFSD